MILIGYVMAKVAIGFFDTAAVHRMQTTELEAQPFARLDQRLPDMGGLIGADVKLPPELADIGHAVGAGETHADLDFLRSAKGMRFIREIVGRDQPQQIPRFRPHYRQNRLGRGHVEDRDPLIADMAAQPGQIALQRGPRNHQQERGFAKARHRQIAFDTAPGIEHLGIDQPAHRHVHLIRAKVLEKGQRIGTIDTDLPERGHVEHPDPGPHRHMFGLLVFEPVLPLPGITVFAVLPRIGEPIGALPARDLTEHGAARLQVFMQGRAAHPARRCHLPIGEVIGVKQAQCFADPFLQIPAVFLERLGAANIDLPQIEGRLAIVHPLRQRHARPAGRGDTNRVVARRNPIAAQLGCLAQIVAIIGGKAFRPVEEGMDTRLGQHRHAVDRRREDRFEMVEILRQLVKAEVFGNAVHAPGLGLGLKGAEQDFPCVFLVIGAFVGHAQHRHLRQAGDALGHDVEMFAGMQRQGDAILRRQIAPPHPAAIHHQIGGDMPLFAARGPINPGHPAVRLRHAGDLDLFDNPRAAVARALGQRQRDIPRIGLPVERQMHPGGDAINVQMGIKVFHLGGGKFIHLNAEGAGEACLAQDFFLAFGRQRRGDRPALPEARGKAGLRFKLGVKIGRVFGETGHVLTGAQLPHQPRRVPCRTRGQLLALQQDDVLPPQFCEMIGHRAAGNAAPDDHDAGL